MNLQLELNDQHIQDLYNLLDGVFHPLNGFLCESDYRSSVYHSRLLDGSVWPIPISLDVKQELSSALKKGMLITLSYQKQALAEMSIESIFEADYSNEIPLLFGTDSIEHVGVSQEMKRSTLRIGGPVKALPGFKKKITTFIHDPYQLSPSEVKNWKEKMGWKTLVGFQTRNPPHSAHEYLQRTALELYDALLIHPIAGWKKQGDFCNEAVFLSYKKMIDDLYPEGRALLASLHTNMQYAGPRSALLHALIRRNFSCTHFIVGRDHAGVGNFYSKYAAHEYCKQFPDIGIEILYMHGPHYCEKCGSIVTEKSCKHEERADVSGKNIREILLNGDKPSHKIMRPLVSDTLLELKKKNQLLIGKNLLDECRGGK